VKNLHFFDKIIFFFNVFFALLLLFSYAFPYAFPKQFPLISVLSLLLPVFIIINSCFLLYWIIRWKKQVVLSFFILLLGWPYIDSFFKFIDGDISERLSGHLSVMTYNVRLFNAYHWTTNTSVDEATVALIREASPDVLCIQEFYAEKENEFADYPYRYIANNVANQKNGQAIFSKVPIINQGSLDFPHTSNNAIYVDVVKDKDTLRIYNLHLQSLKIQPEEEKLTQENSERLYQRMTSSFAIQQSQVKIFDAHRKGCLYKKIVCGDFNNTQYSNTYKGVKGRMKDSFNEGGYGFERTFNFEYFPIRIDFILVDEKIKVLSHNTYRQNYSDHFPIEVLLRF
jgi:vancomycin resistance protein VanJ